MKPRKDGDFHGRAVLLVSGRLSKKQGTGKCTSTTVCGFLKYFEVGKNPGKFAWHPKIKGVLQDDFPFQLGDF